MTRRFNSNTFSTTLPTTVFGCSWGLMLRGQVRVRPRGITAQGSRWNGRGAERCWTHSGNAAPLACGRNGRTTSSTPSRRCWCRRPLCRFSKIALASAWYAPSKARDGHRRQGRSRLGALLSFSISRPCACSKCMLTESYKIPRLHVMSIHLFCQMCPRAQELHEGAASMRSGGIGSDSGDVDASARSGAVCNRCCACAGLARTRELRLVSSSRRPTAGAFAASAARVSGGSRPKASSVCRGLCY